jgi:hypothetical protein
VTAIGTYPEYIDKYTTDLASNAADWFTIQWEDSKGAQTPLTAAIQGGTGTLIDKIVTRVLERDRTLDRRVVSQEAEAAIQQALGENVDPYDPTLVTSISYRKLGGLVYLTMARSYIVAALSTTSEAVSSATMGLVSFKQSSGTNVSRDVESLIDLANRELGISASFVMILADIEECTYPTYDHSRLVSGYVTIDS